MTAEERYDRAVERALALALSGDEMHAEALGQWAEAGPWYEPAAYLRCDPRTANGHGRVQEVSGYVGERLLLLLAGMEDHS